MLTIFFTRDSRGNSLILSGIDELNVKVSAIIAGSTIAVASTSNGSTITTTTTSNPKARPQRRLKSIPWSFHQGWKVVGVTGAYAATAQPGRTYHTVSLHVAIPLARILGRHVFDMSITLQTFPMDPWMFKFNGRGCALARVLTSSHPFMLACRRGDVVDVRGMLHSGEGRVSDLDERSWTPLAVSRC